MKKIVRNLFVLAVFAPIPQAAYAQGITYVSNLNQQSAGSLAVGSDSWLAVGFSTGPNALGYTLNSIQLEMIDASGNPGGFAAMLYSGVGEGGSLPGGNIASLNGSLNPISGGIYAFVPASSTTLSANTAYFIVLTAATPEANGSYNWSYASTFYYNPGGGWQVPLVRTAVYNYESSDGLSWNLFGGPSQFAITATAVPEPAAWPLFFLGGGLLIYARCAFRRFCS